MTKAKTKPEPETGVAPNDPAPSPEKPKESNPKAKESGKEKAQETLEEKVFRLENSGLTTQQARTEAESELEQELGPDWNKEEEEKEE